MPMPFFESHQPGGQKVANRGYEQLCSLSQARVGSLHENHFIEQQANSNNGSSYKTVPDITANG